MPPVRRERRVVLLPEARQRVLELRELDLELAVPALGALGEDVEDELRAVDDLEVGELRDGARLRGRELAVEDEHVRVELDRADDDLLELALAHDELRVDVVAHLDDASADLDARGARELAELAHALLGLAQAPPALGSCRRRARGSRARPSLDLAGPRAARELGLEVAHEPRRRRRATGAKRHRADLAVACGAAVRARGTLCA